MRLNELCVITEVSADRLRQRAMRKAKANLRATREVDRDEVDRVRLKSLQLRNADETAVGDFKSVSDADINAEDEAYVNAAHAVVDRINSAFMEAIPPLFKDVRNKAEKPDQQVPIDKNQVRDVWRSFEVIDKRHKNLGVSVRDVIKRVTGDKGYQMLIGDLKHVAGLIKEILESGTASPNQIKEIEGKRVGVTAAIKLGAFQASKGAVKKEDFLLSLDTIREDLATRHGESELFQILKDGGFFNIQLLVYEQKA